MGEDELKNENEYSQFRTVFALLYLAIFVSTVLHTEEFFYWIYTILSITPGILALLCTAVLQSIQDMVIKTALKVRVEKDLRMVKQY